MNQEFSSLVYQPARRAGGDLPAGRQVLPGALPLSLPTSFLAEHVHAMGHQA